jgi:hypothetical protein
MTYFDHPPGQRVLREFTIRPDTRNHWVTEEAHGLSGGVFTSLKDAVRFALREADGDADRVRIEQPAPPRLQH